MEKDVILKIGMYTQAYKGQSLKYQNRPSHQPSICYHTVRRTSGFAFSWRWSPFHKEHGHDQLGSLDCVDVLMPLSNQILGMTIPKSPISKANATEICQSGKSDGIRPWRRHGANVLTSSARFPLWHFQSENQKNANWYTAHLLRSLGYLNPSEQITVSLSSFSALSIDLYDVGG